MHIAADRLDRGSLPGIQAAGQQRARKRSTNTVWQSR
jgi:hypothetical protein